MRALLGFALLLSACSDRAIAPPSPPDLAPPVDLGMSPDLGQAPSPDLAMGSPPLAVCAGKPTLLNQQQMGAYPEASANFALDGDNVIIPVTNEYGGVVIVPKTGGTATTILKNVCRVDSVAASDGHAFVACYQGNSYDIDLSTNSPTLIPGLSGPPDITQSVVVTANAGQAAFVSSSNGGLTLVQAGSAPQAVSFPAAMGSVNVGSAVPFGSLLLIENWGPNTVPAVTFLYDPVAQTSTTLDAGYGWSSDISGDHWTWENGLIAPNTNELILGTYNNDDTTLSLSSVRPDGSMTPLAATIPAGALGASSGGGQAIAQIAADNDSVYFINNAYGLATAAFTGDVSVVGVVPRSGGPPCLYSNSSLTGAAYVSVDDDAIYISVFDESFPDGDVSTYLYRIPKPN
jgi:hypothetical protein